MVVSPPLPRVLVPVALASVLSATSFAGDPLGVTAGTPESAIPDALLDVVRETLDADACQAVRTGDGWEARSRGGLQSTRFVDGSIELSENGAEHAEPFGLTLERVGRLGQTRAVEDADVVVEGRFVEYRRGPIVEWYVNDERGLEQGFTLDVPPTGEGPLELRIAVDGGYRGQLIDPRSMRLESDEGPTVEYSGLTAWDVDGRDLDAWLSFDDAGLIVLRVDDEDANYPVTIDPIVTFEEAELVGSDSVNGDRFGFSISLYTDYAIVGAPFHETAGEQSGAAYVFVRTGSTWAEDEKLTASDAAAFELFGHSVAIYERGGTARAVVGAPGNVDFSVSTGKAYVFIRNGGGWSEQEILTASDADSDDMFGYSVAISPSGVTPEESILVGAPGNDDDGSMSGAAYVFRRNGVVWPEEEKLTASDAGPLDMYGRAVAIYLERLVIGSPGDDVQCTDPLPQNCDSGAAYTYERDALNDWINERKLVAAEPGNEDQFGSSVAIFADVILIGAPFDDDEGLDAGTAYAFARSGGQWPQEGQLLPGVLQSNDDFGRSVCLNGNVGLVGAPETDTACATASCDSGSAFLFLRQAAYFVGATAETYVGLAFDVNTDTLYGSNGAELFTLDPATGTDASVGSFLNAVMIQGLAFDPNSNTLYGTDDNQRLYTINTATGEATEVGIGAAFISGLAFDPNNNILYGSSPFALRLFTINTATGATSAVGPPGSIGPNPILDLAYDANTDTLYGYDAVQRQIVSLDVATGEPTDAGAWGNFGATGGLTFDSNTNRLFGHRTGSPALLAVVLPIWTMQAEIVPAFTAAGDNFGESVSMGDGLAGVGAPFRSGTGTAHIFQAGSGANLCEDAHFISGEGLFLFDNVGASTDGDPHPSCVFPNAQDQNFSDVWYRWTAECTADVNVKTCFLTAVDTQIAVYDGADCPATTSRLLVCDNDLSPCGFFGQQTEVVFPAVEGQEYLIRIGSSAAPANRQGSGLMEITFVCSLCPANTLASTSAGPSTVAMGRMLASLHRLRDAMRTTPNGQRLVNLYYKHAGEMTDLLSQRPRLRRLVFALLQLLQPGVEALTDESATEEVVFSPHAVMLIDSILREFEDGSADGELARAIQAERARFDLGSLAGKSFADAWTMFVTPEERTRVDAQAIDTAADGSR